MKRVNILSGLVLVFLSGVCIGAVGGYLYTQHKIESLVKSGPPPQMMPRLMRRLTRELALTPSERADLEPIMRDMMASLSDLRQRYHPELEGIMESHFTRMKDKLPPGKGRKLETVQARLRRWGRKSRPPGVARRAGAERVTGLLRQELDMSPEQMLRLRTLLRERLRQERTRPPKPGPPEAPPGSDPDHPPLWGDLETDLQRILTPNQMAAYQRLKAGGRLGPGGGRDLPEGPAPSPD